jgi:hypothetical protein
MYWVNFAMKISFFLVSKKKKKNSHSKGFKKYETAVVDTA